MVVSVSESVDRVHGPYKRIAVSEFLGRGNTGPVLVSTALLANGFSYGGAFFLYETRVFGGPHDGKNWRSADREEALKNHREAVFLH